MFSSINVSVLGAVDALKGYVAAKWLDFRGWFKPRFASCKETVKARTERAGFAVKDCYDRARVVAAPAVAVALDHSRQARERILALAPLVRDGLALVVGLPVAFLGTQAVLGAAQAIGLGIIKLALVAILADVLLGLLPWQSRTDLRRTLRGAVAAGLLGIAFAGSDPRPRDRPPAGGPGRRARVRHLQSPPSSPPMTRRSARAGAPAPDRPGERRTRRRAAGSNGRA